MSLATVIVLAVATQRLVELVLARRNTGLLLARGGREVGRGHYHLIVLMHALWLVALLVLAAPGATISWTWIAIFAVLQVIRLWVIVSLGERWTTRIIVVPGRPLERRGPYRYLRHPNYLVVTAEIAVLPLAFGAWDIALVFSLLNAVLLGHRVRVENRALIAAEAAARDPAHDPTMAAMSTTRRVG